MDPLKYTMAPMTRVPDAFLPLIGRLVVEHAFLEEQLQAAIRVLAGADFSTATSFTSEVPATSKRVEIFKNLARAKEPDLKRLVKMLILGDTIVKLSVERNTLIHSLPYFVNSDATELGYFKDENKTIPQISVNPPYRVTKESIIELADNIRLAAIWLGMLQKNWMPDGLLSGKTADETALIIRDHAGSHPDWNIDSRFPWLTDFEKKLARERAKSQNSHRA